MAVRVTATEVKEIIDTDLADSVVDTFITAASLVVDEQLEGEGLSSSLLKEIERWLSAHMVAMRQRQLSGETLLGSSEQYGGKFGMGLEFTQYGQQVSMLDTTGKIASAGKNARAIVAKVL